MKKFTLVLAVCVPIVLAGCSNMSRQQQATVSGGAIGAAAGAGISAVAGGDAVVGGLVGAAVGAGAGAISQRNR